MQEEPFHACSALPLRILQSRELRAGVSVDICVASSFSPFIEKAMIHDRSFMAETANNHIMLAPPLICQAKESLHDVEGSLLNQSFLIFTPFYISLQSGPCV